LTINKLKLLLLIHRLPCPPDRGSKLRAAVELRYLAKRHDVWCAGFDDTEASPESRASLDEYCSLCRDVAAVRLFEPLSKVRAAHRLLTGSTATEGYFFSPRLRRQVMRWSREVGFDAVLACSSSMAELALQVKASRRVLDFVDLDSRKWVELEADARWPMRWVYGTEARRLARREAEWMSAFDASVVCADRELDLLTEDMPRDRVHVIKTGAASDPEQIEALVQDQAVSLPAEPIVGFVGAMDYEPNVDAACWFAESIWPRVRRRCNDARWWVVGRSPAPEVRRLHDDQGIRVTGTVPAVEPYLEQMRVNVAPLRVARGLQTKVLTAMATGRPCVVTPCVAEGIGAVPDRELVIAETPGSFAEAVVGLLENRQRAEAIGRAGRALVARKFRPTEGLERLEGLLTGECDTALPGR
jgi:sugar transferase (PEP-CTERM/EpsH1 system associated)